MNHAALIIRSGRFYDYIFLPNELSVESTLIIKIDIPLSKL